MATISPILDDLNVIDVFISRLLPGKVPSPHRFYLYIHLESTLYYHYMLSNKFDFACVCTFFGCCIDLKLISISDNHWLRLVSVSTRQDRTTNNTLMGYQDKPFILEYSRLSTNNHRNGQELVSRINAHTQYFKGSSDRSHFIFEINVGKSRILQRTTLNLNDAVFNQF